MTDQINDPKKPGYSWIEVNHRTITAEQGVAALVDIRFRFVGKNGEVVNTPGSATGSSTLKRLPLRLSSTRTRPTSRRGLPAATWRR